MKTGSSASPQDDRFNTLEARLRQIEEHLGLKWVEPNPEPEAPIEAPASGSTGEAEVTEQSVEVGPVADQNPATAELLDRREAARRWLEGQRAKQQEQQTDWASLEQRVGQRWASIAGALTFIVGMGLLFAVAWRRGWFEAIPPGVKCAMGALVGFAMLVAAEFVRKKMTAMAAIGLNAAGLGVVYLSAYASFAMFDLVSPGVAFGLLASVAFLGIAIAARSKFASVGVVALIGGYLTPFLVTADNPSPWVMPIHLTVLLGLAVGLTAWRGPMFVAVRTTALFGTLLIGALWALESTRLPLTPVLMFVAAVWALFNAETCKAVTKWALGTNEATVSAHASIVGAVIVTAWSLGVAVASLQRAEGVAESLDWTVPLVLALASGALAWRLVPDVRRLLDKPTSLVENFACVLTFECFALVPIAVALGLSGWLRLGAWGVMAVAAAFAARRTKLWPLAVYAVALLGVTTFQLVVFESWRSDVLGVGVLVQDIYFSRWMAIAAVLAAAWLAVARLVGLSADASSPLSPAWRLELARVAAVAGAALCLVLWFHTKTESRALTFVLPVVAAALLFARGFWPRLWVDHAASVGVKLIVGFWLVEYVSDNWLGDGSAAFMHAGLWSSFLVAAAALIAAWLTENPGWSMPPRSNRTIVGWSVAGGTLFISTSFEIARVAKIVFVDATARSSAVSVWWALVAIGLIVLGFAILRPWPRRVGLGLLGLALAKVVVYDLAALSLEWRTVSFLALGSVMLAVGLVYGKVAARLQKAAEPAASGTEDPPTGDEP
jgi:uncharacterized membrane protein